MSLKIRNQISIVVMALLAVGVFLFVWKVMLFGPRGPYEVKAEFADSGGITKNSQVKIGGVPGGTVEDIDLKTVKQPDGTFKDTAVVTMKLEDGAYPIGAGATAASRPVNLLGEKYVELKPGDRNKPQDSGVTIPADRTTRPVELDDLLNTLQPDVRARMRILFNEAGIALAGRGSDFNKTLEQLPPALDETRKLVEDFSADNRALDSAIVQSDRVIASFNRENEDLQRLISSADETLEITADKRRQIGATLREAPGTVRRLTGTLAELGGTARELEPMSRQLRQTAPQLDGALKELPDFQKAAGPALEAAEDVAPSLTRLGRDARRPVERLEPVMSRLDTFSQRLQPVLDIADKDRGLVGLINVMNNWENVILREDGLSTTFGTFVSVDPTSLNVLVSNYLDVLNGKKKSASRRREDPAGGPVPTVPLPKGDELKAPANTNPTELLPKIKLPDLPKLPDLIDNVPLPEQLKDTAKSLGTTVDQLLDLLTGQKGQKAEDQKGPTGKLLDYLLGP